MAIADVQLFLALDAVSVGLAGLVAAFFLRSHQLWPERSLGVLGAAFVVYALSHATASLSGFDLVETDAVDASRTLGVTAAGLMVLAAYVFRWLRVPAPTMVVVGASLCLATLGAVLFYGLRDTEFPLRIFPWLRLLDTIVLLAASGLSVMRLRPARLADLQVPLAYSCLALSRYSAALTAFMGEGQPGLANYAWRLAGLLLMAALAVRRWPRAPP